MVASFVGRRPVSGLSIPARARGLALASGVVLLASACAERTPPARITYSYPWLGPAISLVAQSQIRSWRSGAAIEIPDSLMGSVALRPGLEGEIDYAVAMTAVPGIVAAVGHLSSRATLLVAPIYAEHRIPLIAPTATSRRLHAAGPWVFQLAPDDEVEGAFMARVILDRMHVRRVSIFYLVADEYGIGLRAGLVDALRARGVAPVDEVGIFEGSPFDRRVAESLKRAVPDIVVVAARTPEAIAIARSVHARVPRALLLVGDAVLLDESFVKAVGQAATSIHGVTWWHVDATDTVSRSFVRRFERLTGSRPTAIDAMEDDAIMVAAQAVRQAGPHPQAVRRYLSELGSKRPAYQGVTGPISFGPNRRVNLVLVHVSGGTVVIEEGS
jgi:ABC-type branched-subunit amino acid transport system substrate-binding protein